MTPRIAVVGMACRYPDADDPHQLWQTVLAGRRAFRRIPPERLRVADYQDGPGGADAPDGIHAQQAALLENWTFDRSAFRVPGPAYRATDLTHWLALDVAAAALRDAGRPDGEGLDRDRVGVVIGNSLTGEFSRASLVRLRWPYVRRTLDQVLRDRGTAPTERRDLLDALETAYKAPFPAPGDETLAGGLANTISGRICNHFDFHGAGYTVDGACASSLISVVTACTALAQGDLDFALAGGVDLSLDPFELVGFSRLGALAREPMRVYDRNPTGFLPGEGCGIVALAREDDAVRAGLRIHARIEGWGMSSDGHGGLTRPEHTGQALALRRAYARAGFGPDRVGLVEGHGTGTAVGDQVELAVLDAELRAAGHRPGPPPALGSIKANIGHTKAAAGAAGLIKAVLAVHHGVLPPTTGCPDPHPLLGTDAADGPALRVLTEPEEWSAGERHASVNSLGFGGINAHVVIGTGPAPRTPALTTVDRRRYAPAPGCEVFPLSGDDPRELAARLTALADAAETLSAAECVDAAAELARRADPARRHRVAVVASGPEQLAERLRLAARRLAGDDAAGAVLRLDTRAGVFTGTGPAARLGLLFPGQGASGRTYGETLARLVPADDLFASVPETKRPQATAPVPPAAEASTTDLATPTPAVLAPATPTTAAPAPAAPAPALPDSAEPAPALPHLAAPAPALLDSAAPASGAPDLALSDPADTAVVQPAVVAASMAGLRYLRELGVHADAALGHSLGEISALCWADALTPVDAVRLAATRGALMSRHAERGGGMLAVAAPPDAVAPLLAGTGAVVAALNGPRHVTVAGPRADLDLIRERAHRQGTPALPLTVSHAFHSAAMRPALAALARCFAEAPLASVTRTVVSSVTGKAVPPDTDLAALLTEQVLAPVAFADGVRALARRADLLLEVGPGTTLATLAGRTTDLPVLALDTTAAPAQLARTTAALFAACGADPTPWTRHRFSRPIEPTRPRRFLANPCEQAPAPRSAAGREDTTAPPGRYPADADTAEPTGDTSGDPLAVVRQLVAEALEFDAASIREDDLLLADLHINSLRIVQIAADAAARLGRAAPASTAPLAIATVAGLAAYLAELPPAGSEDDGGTTAGVGPWVRAYTHRLVPSPHTRPAPGGATRYSWARAVDAHPLADTLRTAFPDGDGTGPRATVVALPPHEPGHAAAPVESWAAALYAAVAGPGPLVLVHHRGVGAAMARSIAVERPDLPCLVVDVPAHADGIRRAAAEAARGVTGYTEVVYDDEGTRHQLVTAHRPLSPPDPAAVPLGPADVCLVTGGAKGIGAESALALARATGVRLALLGRSRPEDDDEVATNLRRFHDLGLTAHYLRADVTDPAAVRARVAEAQDRLGPVTAVLHCAGLNEPGLVETLTPRRLHAATAPKAGGLDAVLAAVDTARLRLLVAFGSVIARIGVPGESAYALANELLRLRVEETAAALPHCRCLTLEWSQWAGAGMAQRLGAVESLRRQGVDPIPVDTGTDLFLSLLGAPDLPTTVMVAGRLPRLRTLRHADESLPLSRFLENPVVHQPGVELVADAELSLGTDPYLADHVIDGVPVLPAVVGLEAMAQAAAAVTGAAGPPGVTDGRFERPVTVPAHGSRTVRVAALRHDDGTVETVLRSAETGFAVDHFRATYRFPATTATTDDRPPTARATPAPAAPSRSPYYGDLFFHGPRFRHLVRYELLGGRRCEALVDATPAAEWFSGFHSPHLVLGDPGVRDTFVHLLQGCVPHRRVLPVAVDAVRVHRPVRGGTVVVKAYETAHDADGYRYELTVEDPGGTLLETWHGLRLKDVGPLPRTAPWPAELLGPYLARSLDRLLPDARTDLAIGGQYDGDEGHAHRPGAPDKLLAGEKGFVSVGHYHGHVLVAVADRPVAVHWEAAAPPQTAFARARTCRETLNRLGADPGDTPLVVEHAADDGWVLLRCGEYRIAGLVAEVAGLPHPVAVSLCVGTPTGTRPTTGAPAERNRTPS